MAGRAQALKALILGGVAWNTMVFLDAFPDARPQTVFARRSHEAVGSSGAGKAMNLRHLGADVTLWGLIGDDEPGRRIRREVEERGIDFVGVTDPRGTARHVNLMDAAGGRISIFANAGSDTFDVDVSLVEGVAASSDLVSVTAFNHCRPFLPMLKETGTPIWVDLHDYDAVDRHHDAFIDVADGLLMSSTAMPDWRRFLERRVGAGTGVALCTHGSAGASGLSAEEGWVDVPAAPVDEVVDTNGAGDAFFAGFVVARHAGASFIDALHAGAAAASATIQSPDLAPQPLAPD